MEKTTKAGEKGAHGSAPVLACCPKLPKPPPNEPKEVMRGAGVRGEENEWSADDRKKQGAIDWREPVRLYRTYQDRFPAKSKVTKYFRKY